MENFKEALIQFSQSNPSLFPNDADNSYPMLIEQCFHQFFADFQTPEHPTYPAMIYRAIWELNKKGGSSEKSISKFIEKEYADLPWAHSTLLKHHLQNLCDRDEIRMTTKQCYLLAGADSEPKKKSSGPCKKLKKQKSRLGSEAGKKISSPNKKYNKKKKCMLDIQEISDKKQTGLNKRKRKQKLKSRKKSSKRVKTDTRNMEIKLQLKEENLELDDDVLLEQKQMIEVNMDDIQVQEQNEVGQESHHDISNVKEQTGLRKKQRLKSNKKSSKRVNKGAINEEIKLQFNEAYLKQNKDELHEPKQTLEVDMNEADQESHHDNSGHINLEQIQTKKNPDVLQPEESPDSKLISYGNGKRVWTRSQLKTISKKVASDKPAVVENLSNEEQISRSPSSEKPCVELLKSISSKLTQLPDDEPKTGPRSTEKSTVEGKPKYKRSGRLPKPMEPKKDEVLCNPKSAAILRKSQKSAKKGEVVNKKVQPNHKHDVRHNMTRRSSKKPKLLY